MRFRLRQRPVWGLAACIAVGAQLYSVACERERECRRRRSARTCARRARRGPDRQTRSTSRSVDRPCRGRPDAGIGCLGIGMEEPWDGGGANPHPRTFPGQSGVGATRRCRPRDGPRRRSLSVTAIAGGSAAAQSAGRACSCRSGSTDFLLKAISVVEVPSFGAASQWSWSSILPDCPRDTPVADP